MTIVPDKRRRSRWGEAGSGAAAVIINGKFGRQVLPLGKMLK